MPIQNDYCGMSEEIFLNDQVIMNIIGNNLSEDDKGLTVDNIKIQKQMKGLLFTDFCYNDNNLIILFGKIIIFINLEDYFEENTKIHFLTRLCED